MLPCISAGRLLGPAVRCLTARSVLSKRSFATYRKLSAGLQTSILDEWVSREAKPVSLRQLTVFGRSLTEARLLSSANYVRTEMPTRLAHRIRDLQNLPYSVLRNPHMAHVYKLYCTAFETFRRVPEVKTVEENDKFCNCVREQLQGHLTVIPRLVTGVLECQGYLKSEAIDVLMTTMLRSRISRRVIAEQHLALTETFHSPWHFPDAEPRHDADTEFIGEVFLRCNAHEIVQNCAETIMALSKKMYGADVRLPQVRVQGHLNATLTYIPSHLEYIIGELLRNSVQAVVENKPNSNAPIPPIQVLICETPQQVIIRISDEGGGISRDMLPTLWSFIKGPRRKMRLENLNKVPRLAATLQDLKFDSTEKPKPSAGGFDSSLTPLTSRPPDLRLGIGLPMSRVYAEYWAGTLELHSLEGYGVDAFLQVPKLGNKNEQLSTRASMDAL